MASLVENGGLQDCEGGALGLSSCTRLSTSRVARRAEYLEHMNSFGSLATKLLRTFTAQTEALAKLRRGGEQTLRVEHVHVHS